MTPLTRLLVTTTQAAWLLDTATGVARLIDRGRGVYYGITFSEDEVFIACRRAPVGADRESQRNVILRFDLGLRCTGMLEPPVPLRDVHQIVFADGVLHACSTYDDAVLRYDLGRESWSTWRPFGASDGRDRHHINSILVTAEATLLAGTHPAGWFARIPRGDDGETARPVMLGRNPHNVWLERGQAHVCSSDEGAIRSERGDIHVVAGRGWLRGVAFDGHHRYIGVSRILAREDRGRSDCMILQLDAAGRTVAVHGFLGDGMLHDLRAAGCADGTHNGIALHLAPGAPHGCGEERVVSRERISLPR